MKASTTIDRVTFYVTVAAVAIAVTWGIAYAFIASERDAELRQRIAQAGNVSLLLEQHTLRVLHHADTIVRAARSSFYDGGYEGVARFLGNVELENDVISHLTLMDKGGVVRFISAPDPGGKATTPARDRHYFQVQERATEDVPHISYPHRGRISGLMTIRYVMRLQKPDGAFDGVIFAAISVPKLVQFFDNLNIADESVFAVIGTDKIVRAHTLADRLRSETSFASSQVWDRLAQSPVGVFEENSVLDGIGRIYAYRKMTGFPLVVLAGISKSGIHRVGENAIAVAILITLCILIVTALIRDKVMSHERVLGAVFDTAADAIVLADERGIISGANPASERIFGYPRDDLIGMPLSRIVPALDGPPSAKGSNTLADRMRRLLGGTQELTGRRHNGSEFPVLLSLIETMFGRGSFFTCILHDYSAQKHIENLLLQSESRFKDFAETASDFYWETDDSLRFTYLSERFAHASGVAPTGLIGKKREESGITAVDPHEFQIHLDDLENHRPFRNFVYARERNDGARMWLSISGKPIFDADGAFRGYRGTGTDITAAVEARRELMKAKEEAEHANRAKTIFLSSMSHELRTPLNAIIGFAEALDMGIGMDDPKRRSETLKLIVSAGKQLNGLIGDVLDFAKIEEGRIDFDPEPVSPEAIYLDCLPVVQYLADERGVTFQRGGTSTATVYVDTDRLRQILLNFLSNAIKYNRQGGTVEFSCEETPEGSLRIAVRDTGIGIPENLQRRVFDPFDRLRRHVKDIPGSGIGLSITRRLVEAMGGSIGFQSEPDVGSTFWAEFPIYRGAGKVARLS